MRGILFALIDRWVCFGLQGDAGVADGGGVSMYVPKAASGYGSGGVLDGLYETNFVVVSVLVGVIFIAALVYLVRRLVPARFGKGN